MGRIAVLERRINMWTSADPDNSYSNLHCDGPEYWDYESEYEEEEEE